MNELMEKEIINVEDMIYEIRGVQVMLDSDLAKLYQCSNGTKSINLAVKRHINRFPERFMFRLTEDELTIFSSRFQTETLNENDNKRGSNIKYLPYVFTEQGVAMLATVLRTEVAEQVSIQIMDAFVAMRKYISSNLLEQKYINNMVLKHDGEIRILQETFEKFTPKNNHLFFEGQIYDAHSLLLDIIDNAKESIIIIDNYADKKLLDLLSKTKKKIEVYSKNMNDELIKRYSQQYNNVEVIKNESFHDRFIIIDNKDLYHCGSSFKELGKKCFAITKIESKEWLEKIYLSLNCGNENI